jgi:hypothetical protein
MDIFDNKTNTMYFYTQKITSIQNYTNIVIMKSEKVNLPLRPLNQHKITLFNHSGKTILIDTNSTTDLMYSQMYAPRGEKAIFLEDKFLAFTFYIFPLKIHDKYCKIA